MGNIRAILHQGVERWLAAMRDDPPDDQIPRLVEALDNEIELREAAKWLTFALETVAENYTEYRDYNATTTQSDQGDLLFAFVDFLRLRNDYDRIAWNLKPVVLAHEVLVRRGRSAAAGEWRRALVGRTEEAADDFGERHAELCAEYGMWLPTIAGRLDERFTRPLDVGRIRALVGSAVEEAFRGDSNVTFAVLEHEVEKLAAEPCGAGLDVPDWLEALEDEVDRARSELDQGSCDRELLPDVPQVCISWEELRAQLDDAEAMFPK
jgi:hypothetical protein